MKSLISSFLHEQQFVPWLLISLVIVVVWMVTSKRRRQQMRRQHNAKTHRKMVVQFQRASRFTPEAIPEKAIDTIVIGSGPGGCTCANLLAQQGQTVLVLEQHETTTGGGTHSFRIQNCEWDTGLHYTSKAMSQATARPGAIMDYMSHGKQKFRQFPEPYDEIVFPDHASYPYMNGKDRTIDAILDNIDGNTDPELKRRVRTYMDIYTDVHRGFVALGISRILPRCLHFLVQNRVDKLMKYAALTVRDVQHAVLNLGYSKEDVLKACPTGPFDKDSMDALRRLKSILAHPIGDYGVQPRDASMAAHSVTAEHYIDGGSYTVGPTSRISTNLLSVVRSCGGEAFVDATVRGIIIEKGKAGGVLVSNTSALQEMGPAAPVTEIRAKNIVCGTSAYNLYNKLLPQDLEVVQKFRDPTERTIRQSNGHCFAFCKLRGDPDELQLPDHNVWFFNGDDLDQAYDDYYASPTTVRPPIVYIGFPCTKDPTWESRFPGISNCIVISDSLYEWFEKWADKPVGHRGADYDALKESITKSLMDVLFEFVPQVKDKLEFVHLATPLTEESFLTSFRGGAYDTLCTPQMFAPVNQKWVTTPHTQIPGIYLAGSSSFFPGLTGAMYGGCLCACAVLGHVGSLRLGHAVISNLAKRLQEEDPKLTWFQAYYTAVDKFINE